MRKNPHGSSAVGILVSRVPLPAHCASCAARVPVASDVTVEADSGGHTDNQALPCVFPTIAQLRDALVAEHGVPIRVGAAGGLGTPSSLAAAFAMGAAYVLTGESDHGGVAAVHHRGGCKTVVGSRIGRHARNIPEAG